LAGGGTMDCSLPNRIKRLIQFTEDLGFCGQRLRQRPPPFLIWLLARRRSAA